jgi:AraC family ethanolamine operon transcriptional activator
MITQTHYDFEEFAAAIKDADGRVMLTRMETPEWRTSYFELGPLGFQLGFEASGIIHEAALRPGGMAMFVPLRNPTAITWNGRPCDAESVILQSPGGEFCCTSVAANEWASLFIPASFFGERSNHATSGCQFIVPPRSDLDRFVALVQRIATATRLHPEVFDSSASAIAADELAQVMLSLFTPEPPRASSDRGRPVIPRERILAPIRELLATRRSARVSIHDLTAAAGVSERTLRTVFCDHYGVAPKRYLKLRVLHQVRAALRAADPETTTVTSIATQFGVWELGQFASEYRQHFGELPSATLSGRSGDQR